MIDEQVRAQLRPFTYDGSEAVAAVIELMTAFHRPPDLRKALCEILQRHYAETVPVDAVVELFAEGA